MQLCVVRCCVVLDVVLICVTLSSGSDMMRCIVGCCVVLCSNAGYSMVCGVHAL